MAKGMGKAGRMAMMSMARNNGKDRGDYGRERGGEYRRQNYNYSMDFTPDYGRQIRYDGGEIGRERGYRDMGDEYGRGRERGMEGYERGVRERDMYGREGRRGSERSGHGMMESRSHRSGRMSEDYDDEDYDEDDEEEYSHRKPIRAGGTFWMDAPEKKHKLTKEQAEEWVSEMDNEDPSHPEGGKWTMEEVKPLAQKYEIPTDGQKFIDFYAMMNAMYSDYYKVAKKYGVANPDFFAEMAKAFVCDKDAKKNKTALYYDYIVQH